ncbi:MAG: serine/threonine-protein kinase, partial [Polyangia bacterium]
MGASPSPDEFRGTDRFQVLRRLGAGASGVVYEVFDRQHDSVVALKTLERTEPAHLYLFKQEFRELADVHHPHLVTLYELLHDRDRWFITMELVRGLDFFQYVRGDVAGDAPGTVTQTTPPTPETPTAFTLADTPRARADEHAVATGPVWTRAPLDAAALARLRQAAIGLARGIVALHGARKLHRDLKPSNVRVEAGGRVVLLDFGLVVPLRADGGSQTLHVAGTPAFMSPEQGAGETITEASDWYAAGVMLFHALTGVTPFAGMSSAALLHAKQTFDPPAPGEVAPGVPEDLGRLCVALLRRDPATRPRGRAVLATLERGVSGAPTPMVSSGGDGAPPFVGRGAELARLDAARSAVAAGRPALVWLHGASGIGKTRLSQYFVEKLMEREAAVLLAGRCYQQESVPFKGLDSAVDALSRFLMALPDDEVRAYRPRDVVELGRVFPVLRQLAGFGGDDSERLPRAGDRVEQRRRAFAALRELLRRIAARRLLVMALDDLQWGGDDSGALLAELLQPPDAPAMLVLGTYRSDEAAASPMLRRLGPELDRVAHALHKDEIALAALPPDQARALAAAVLGDVSRDDVARRIADESEGSPFFVCEFARHRRAVASAPEPSLGDVILARIDLLQVTARRLLETIAVAGRPLARSLALRAADVADDSAGALAELRSAHLIRVRGDDVVEAYHDRIRTSLLSRLDAGRCASLHLRLAELMEADGNADPEHVTRHLLSAGEPRRAAPWAAQAARRAESSLAFERAAELYRLALELATWSRADELDRVAHALHKDEIALAALPPDQARA